MYGLCGYWLGMKNKISWNLNSAVRFTFSTNNLGKGMYPSFLLSAMGRDCTLQLWLPTNQKRQFWIQNVFKHGGSNFSSWKTPCYGNHCGNTKHVEAMVLYSTVGVYRTWESYKTILLFLFAARIISIMTDVNQKKKKNYWPNIKWPCLLINKLYKAYIHRK